MRFGGVFHIHEEVLRSSSAFFDTALRKQWAKGTSGRVDLPDVDAEAFGIYTEWLYTGVLRLSSALDMRRVCTEQELFQIKTAEQHCWVRCYEADDFLQDTDFKDALVDTVAGMEHARKEGKKDLSLFFAILYRWTTADSPHRKFVTDMFVGRCSTSKSVNFIIDKLVESVHYEMMVPDLLRAYSKIVIKKSHPVYPSTLEEEDMCKHHEHARNGGKCYREKRDLVQVH